MQNPILEMSWVPRGASGGGNASISTRKSVHSGLSVPAGTWRAGFARAPKHDPPIAHNNWVSDEIDDVALALTGGHLPGAAHQREGTYLREDALCATDLSRRGRP